MGIPAINALDYNNFRESSTFDQQIVTLPAVRKFSGSFFLAYQLCLCGLPTALWAQTGGQKVFNFLQLPLSARHSALGGTIVNVTDYDLSLSLYNPSTYNSSQDGQLSLNYCDFAADINYGMVAYGKTFGKYHTAAGLQYLNYGRFTGADATSEKTGNFTAGEYALTLGAAQKKDSVFSVGANLKFIYGGLHLQQSFALGADLSASYYNKQRLFHSSILARNIGAELVPFSGSNRRCMQPQFLFMLLYASSGLSHESCCLYTFNFGLFKFKSEGPQTYKC